jgi:hypothetical protein
MKWTPERIIDLGLGPAHVAEILRSRGWTIRLATAREVAAFGMTEVIAEKVDIRRSLFDRAVTTRKREAKILSEALGGRYAFHHGPSPSDWPDDWDHARHDLYR